MLKTFFIIYLINFVIFILNTVFKKMTNFRIKVKINDYFSKIDAIPYNNYICVITCNNCYSIIKLTEHNHQIFQHNYKLIQNMDLLFNLKLINYADNNTLVGMYDLIIPHSKINQICQRSKSVFKQQVKLIMNSKVKIKLFDYLMNIPNIFLDLIFEFSLIDNYSKSIKSKVNQRKISDLLGISEFGNQIKLNKSENVGYNAGFNNNGKMPKKTVSFSTSPVLNYNNNFIHNIYGSGIFNSQNENLIEENHNHYMKRSNKSDINYNVMNNNFLNYFKINNNNNFPLNYKNNISNFLLKNNIESLNQYGNNELYIDINNLNNSSNSKYRTDAKSYKRVIKINNDNFMTEKKRQVKNKSSRSPIMNLERKKENEINNNYSYFKNLTEVKNSFESNVIRSEKKKLELNQNKKNLKFQNCDNKFNNNSINKGNYAKYINNNKPIPNDRRNNNEKYFSNKLIRKIPNTNNNKTNEKQDLNYNNELNVAELPNNKLVYAKIKTPKKLRNLYFTENNPFAISTSSRNNIKEETDGIGLKNNNNNNIYISDENYNNKSTSNYNNHTKQRINFNKIKTSVNQTKTKTDPKKNILGKNYDNYNISDFNDYDSSSQNKRSTNEINIIKSLSEDDNKNRAEKKDNLASVCTQEEVRDKIIQLIDKNYKLKKDIKQNMLKNRKLMNKLILCKSQYYTELKINNHLNNKINDKNIKFSIHVDVRSKLNEKIYFNMKKIKLKESKIFEKIFYEHKNSPEYKAKEAKKKIQEKFEQQKKVHALLKIIRELIQKYDNLSHLYDDDEKKRLLFKSLLVRYGIREKEPNKENNLAEKFKEIQKKIEEEKNRNLLLMKKQEMQNDMYKNVIKEEDSEEKSSTSERIKIGVCLKKKLSWNSEDSILKEKDSASNNKSNQNNDDINNSIVSSGLKIIKERNEEEFLKDSENKEIENDKK